MQSAAEARGDHDVTDVPSIVAGAVRLGLFEAVVVLLFSLGSRLLDPPLETIVLAPILLVGLAGVTLLPGLWTRPRTIEGIAGAAGIGLGATVVFLLIDVVLLQHIGTYTNRWYEIGRSNWWYHPVWWMVGTFLPWMGAWILANQLDRNGRVSVRDGSRLRRARGHRRHPRRVPRRALDASYVRGGLPPRARPRHRALGDGDATRLRRCAGCASSSGSSAGCSRLFWRGQPRFSGRWVAH